MLFFILFLFRLENERPYGGSEVLKDDQIIYIVTATEE